MNGILLLLWTIAAAGQIGASAGPVGVKYGWKPENDGSMSYIAQVTPEIASQMATEGKEMALDVPDFLQGRIHRVVWRIGSADVERDPSEAELRAMSSRQVLPKNNGPGGLTSLSGATDGQPVLIDPMRSSSTTLQPAAVGRSSENDTSIPSVPSLAQSYPSASTRASLNGQFDMPQSSMIGSSGTNNSSLGSKSVLPRQDTLPNSSKSSTGFPAANGSNYTNSPVTVTGTPTGANNGSWSDSRFGNTTGQLNTNNPLATGTFGNANNYGFSNSGSLVSSPNSNFPTTNTNSNGYLTSSTAQPAFSYPNTSSPYNTTGSTNYSNPNQYPDAYLANSNVAANPYGMNGNTQNNGTPPFPSQPYPQTNSGATYGSNGYVNGPTYTATNVPQNVPFLASNGQSAPSITNRPMVDGTRRTTTSRDDISYESYPSNSPNYITALLLLVSLVGNIYLVMQLNQLLQRYRALQASNRGVTSLAI